MHNDILTVIKLSSPLILDMDPNPEMPDFNRFPLPKYEPFKIFSEPKIGAGEKTLNQLRVEKYLDTSKFKQLAKDNMPFMALEIHGLQEVRYLHSTHIYILISTHIYILEYMRL